MTAKQTKALEKALDVELASIRSWVLEEFERDNKPENVRHSYIRLKEILDDIWDDIRDHESRTEEFRFEFFYIAREALEAGLRNVKGNAMPSEVPIYLEKR